MTGILLKNGTRVLCGDRQLEIVGVMSTSKMQARDLKTGEYVCIAPGDIACEIKTSTRSKAEAIASLEILDSCNEFPDAEYEVAIKRKAVIENLLTEDYHPVNIAKELASRLDISLCHSYRLLSKYDKEVGALSLMRLKRGRKLGAKIISDQLEGIIEESIKEGYVGVSANYTTVVSLVNEYCRRLGLKPPSEGTILRRIKGLGKRELIKKKWGAKKASQETKVRGGKHITESPLSLIQMDHCLVDCIVVDKKTRQPLCRPWVTLAIDVHTRVILGFHLSLSYPSGMSVALCMAHAILPKEQWLNKLGMDDCEYPFYGKPSRVHVDNAKEFRSPILKAGCINYGITLTWRPPATPHNGAHVERLIGTLMGKAHFLPGTTMSSIIEKGDYDSEKNSALTFDEFRVWFVSQVEIYHKKKHSALGCSPIYEWESYFKREDGSLFCPNILDEPKSILLNFMPSKPRTIRREGVIFNKIYYYSHVLRRYSIGTKCQMRYDPESLRKIWLKPEGETSYFEVTYSDLRLPDASIYELRYFRKKLASSSEARVDNEEVLKLAEKSRQIVESAVRSTKAVRIMKERHENRKSTSHPLNNDLPPQDESAAKDVVDYSKKPIMFQIED